MNSTSIVSPQAERGQGPNDSLPGPSSVSPIPAFSDNYIWLLDNGDGTALVVDPGDAAPVQARLEREGLALAGILITHHHFDHVGGLKALVADHACPVYGPQNPQIAEIDVRLKDGDRCRVGAYDFEVIEVPGHTLDHIAYYQGTASGGEGSEGSGGIPLLFCGDTLFAGGCGRIFEGTPEMMFASLRRLASLPDATLVYCAHEYTLANLAFARAADPSNDALARREQEAKELRERSIPTVPSSLRLEIATNPFLRAEQPQLGEGLAAAGKAPQSRDDAIACFAALRSWKDNF